MGTTRFHSKLVTPLRLLFNTKWAEVLLPALSSFSLSTFPVGGLRVLRLIERKKQDGQKIERHPPHVSVCDSHNSLPQSKHCVLAVLEQGSPSSSAEFLTSMTLQLFGMRPSLRF